MGTVYTFTTSDITAAKNAGVILKLNGVNVGAGSKFSYTNTLTATCNSGKAFYIKTGGTTASINFGGFYDDTGDYICTNPTFNADKTVATFIPKAGITYSNFECNTKTITPQKKLLYTLTNADITLLSINEVDYKINGVTAIEGSQLRLGDVCVAKVTGNRKFYIDQTNQNVTSIRHFGFDDDTGDMFNLNYALSDNDQTATFTVIDNSGNISGYGFDSFKVSTRIETTSVIGNNNVYKITNDTLALVNKERFTIIAGSNAKYDYGQYILSVLQFPFDIPDNIIGGSSAIQLADKTLTANGVKLLDDVIKVDLGTITVPNTHNNMLDFAGTQAIIHLPRAPSIVLELEYVIGQTLGVYYLLDCYTGTATINITSTKLEGVISSTQVDIGVRVPYMADSYTPPENIGVVAGGDNGVKSPYIELIRHDSILPNGFFTVPVVDETIINNQTGYIKVDNVELVTGALGNEKEQIISLLNSGVIIK
jgi:hypothetical protein